MFVDELITAKYYTMEHDDKILQLLQSTNYNDHILAIQLAIGQDVDMNDLVEMCLTLEVKARERGDTDLFLAGYGIFVDYPEFEVGSDDEYNVTLADMEYSEDSSSIVIKHIYCSGNDIKSITRRFIEMIINYVR